MTLQDLAFSLGQVAIHYNPLNGYYGTSSIGQLNTTQLLYPAMALVPSGDIVQRKGFNEFNMTFYVIDRLLTDSANDFDIYSFSVETLKNFFKQLRTLPKVVAVTEEPVIRLFHNERDNDRVCGAYSTVALTIEDDFGCPDWLDVQSGHTPDPPTPPTPPTPPAPDTGTTPYIENGKWVDPNRTITGSPAPNQFFYKTAEGTITWPADSAGTYYVGGWYYDSGGTQPKVVSNTYNGFGVVEFDRDLYSGYLPENHFLETDELPLVTEIVLPEGMKEFGNGQGVVEYTSALKTINIPDGVEKIRYSDLCYNSGIKNIIIPSSVNDLGMNAFGFLLTQQVNYYYNGTLDMFKLIRKNGGTIPETWVTIPYKSEYVVVNCLDGIVKVYNLKYEYIPANES